MTINYKTRDLWSRLLSDDKKDRLLKVTALLLAAILCMRGHPLSLLSPLVIFALVICLPHSLLLSALLCPPVRVSDPRVRPVLQLPNDSVPDGRRFLQFPQLVRRASMVPSGSHHRRHHLPGSDGHLGSHLPRPPVHQHSHRHPQRLCLSGASLLESDNNRHLPVDQRTE